MKKFLSIVISILMISAMMSVVALADAATISLADVSGLVANEKISLTPTVSGAAAYTVEVDANAFTVTDGTTVAGVNSKTVTAGQPFELVVNASVPATFTSAIRLTAGDTKVKVNVSVADRLVGDANGVDGVTIYDAALIASYVVNGATAVGDTFKPAAADANGLDGVTIYDAALIAAYVVNGDATIGTAYIGGNTGSVQADIFGSAAVTTPLATPVISAALYKDGNVYYEFTGDSNASSYTITVGSQEFTGITATSGSVTLSGAWNGTDTFDVTAIGDGVSYSNSTAATATITNAPVGAVSTWLSPSGVTAVTVYELN